MTRTNYAMESASAWQQFIGVIVATGKFPQSDEGERSQVSKFLSWTPENKDDYKFALAVKEDIAPVA